MRPGFLVQQAGVQTGDAAQQSVQQPSSGTAAAAAQPPAHAAAAATSGAPPPQRTPEQLSAGLAECLELLKGPSDERRYACNQLQQLESGLLCPYCPVPSSHC